MPQESRVTEVTLVPPGLLDLLALLAQWGCTTCPAEDLDANGIVDIDDLLAIMANWGDCP